MRGLRRLREAVSGGWSWRSSGLLGPGVLCTVLHTGTDQVWMMFHVVSNGCVEITSLVGMCFYSLLSRYQCDHGHEDAPSHGRADNLKHLISHQLSSL